MATNIVLNNKLAMNDLALAGQIYATTINKSIWTKLIAKEAWQPGLADTHEVLTIERNLAANPDVWNRVSPNNGTNTCVPVADIVPRGSTTRQYFIEQKALESDDICVNDTLNAYQVNTQVRHMFNNLRNNVAYVWKRRAITAFVDVSANKTVVAPGRPTAADHFPNIAPTSPLTQQFLNSIYVQLISDSAEQDGGSLGMADGRPQFVLVTDMETSDAIMQEANNREAFLWNEKRVPELLAPLGVDRGYRGFYHTIDTLPRRFTFDGTWHEVAPYATVEADVGSKAKLRMEYLQAPYTESYVFLPTVFSFEVPPSISTVGSGTTFQPQSYIGEPKWHNEYDRQDNPDRTIGYYRVVMQAAVKPIMPQFGYPIRHLRCEGELGLRECEGPSSGDSSDLSSGEYFAV